MQRSDRVLVLSNELIDATPCNQTHAGTREAPRQLKATRHVLPNDTYPPSTALRNAFGDAIVQPLVRVLGVLTMLGEEGAGCDRKNDPRSKFVPEFLSSFFGDTEGLHGTWVGPVGTGLLREYFGLGGLFDPLLARP